MTGTILDENPNERQKLWRERCASEKPEQEKEPQAMKDVTPEPLMLESE